MAPLRYFPNSISLIPLFSDIGELKGKLGEVRFKYKHSNDGIARTYIYVDDEAVVSLEHGNHIAENYHPIL